ncbi:uncharacterized protein FMAN_11291 [Fusarium mangiferae]|uniref:Uncharacterized protein n=1 Tax=Fusarium mangiferae TaxID=192010 RepID=A0A1L7TQL2_FUSMA|nr:uncharacterized protein FMAN_11291 [Fusarium mangiferae]CVK97056.1 uncharacterized protein FMAN_11291 [Fusarium mangiferae]
MDHYLVISIDEPGRARETTVIRSFNVQLSHALADQLQCLLAAAPLVTSTQLGYRYNLQVVSRSIFGVEPSNSGRHCLKPGDARRRPEARSVLRQPGRTAALRVLELDEIAEDGEDEDKDQALSLNSMIKEELVVADARPAYRHDLSKFVEVSIYGLWSANQLQKREQQKRRLQDIKVWIHR